MKLETPANEDYAARIVRVPAIIDLPNADRIKGIPLFGRQAIVGTDVQVGDIGVYFPAEVQLSERYVGYNDMFRHPEKNFDTTKVGYIEDNRRVKAIRLRGHRSDALFMPLSSLSCFGNPLLSDFQEGDVFDRLNGEEVCRKFMKRVREPRGFKSPAERLFANVDERFFPQQDHITNFFYLGANYLDPATRVVITQKLHGTNIRIGNVPVRRKLSWLERIAKALGVKVQTKEYNTVFGSHHAIKGLHNTTGVHFYDHDLWADEGEKMATRIPHGFVVYGEVIGYQDSGRPIQSRYTYDRKPNDPDERRSVYVYRVVFVNAEGVAVELSWNAVKVFCLNAGFKFVPEFYVGPLSGVDIESFLDVNYDEYHRASGYELFPMAPVPLSPDSPCDEGVVVRIDAGLDASFYKVKSPIFIQHETNMMDDDTSSDIEAEEAVLAEGIL